MKFSIIIPCYNIENFIEKTLNSIRYQTYDDFEVILVNDGSKDQTLKILANFSRNDDRFKVFSQENRGVSIARNKGIELAKGDFIYFLDGDDIIENNLLEKAKKILDENNVDMFSFGYDLKDGEKISSYSVERYSHKIFSSKEFLKKILTKEISQNICSFIIKKDIIENLKFNHELKMGEDLDYQLRTLLEKDFNIYYSSEVFFHYIKRENSATTKKEFNISEIIELKSLEKLEKEMLNNNIDEFKYYQVIRFFYYIKKMSGKNMISGEYQHLKTELEKYEHILKNFKIDNIKKKIIINILILLYRINLKFLLFVLKILSKLKYR